jgi:hypothetical protein
MEGMTAIMNYSDIKPNVVLRGPIFPEPVQVITTTPMGEAIRLIGKGLNTGKLFDPILSREQLAILESTPETEPESSSRPAGAGRRMPGSFV